MLVTILIAFAAAYIGFLTAGLFSSLKLRDMRRAYLRLAEAVDDFMIRSSFAPQDAIGSTSLARQQMMRLEQALRESDQDYRSLV
jgi:hypothetical protein